jgi:glycine reductase
LKPADQVLYQLPAVDRDLPRIAYINQIQSQGFLCRTFLYGSPMEGDFTPTLLHPNELFDGAVVSGNYRNSLKACTFLQQNNHVALELLKRHGKELNFVGMIIGRGHFDDFQTKERQGQYAAKLASLLGAQAAVLTIEGGGNANVDYMETVRGLELSGIGAVPIVHEWGGARGDEQALIYVVPEAVSIVSGGGIDRLIEVPRMNRVVGGERMKLTDSSAGMDVVDASSSFLTNSYNFYCSFWQMQISGIAARDY